MNLNEFREITLAPIKMTIASIDGVINDTTISDALKIIRIGELVNVVKNKLDELEQEK